jgi:hypothetical protein
MAVELAAIGAQHVAAAGQPDEMVPVLLRMAADEWILHYIQMTYGAPEAVR